MGVVTSQRQALRRGTAADAAVLHPLQAGSMALAPFHLAFPVHSIAEARAFYLE